MKKLDVLIIVICLAAAGLLYASGIFAPGAAGGEAVITQNGEELARLPLDTDAEFITPDGGNRVVVEAGAVSVVEADCPDQVCVNQGRISRDGETIVCLPHRLVVEVVGGEQTQVDAVAQ